MNTVLVFKTSVSGKDEVKKLRPLLNNLTQRNGTWNFDLEDCDNILRVETTRLNPERVTDTLLKNGFYCEELF